MKKFLIRLVFEVRVDGNTEHFDEQWRIFERSSEPEALELAMEWGHSQTSTFGSAGDSVILWSFVHIADCIDLTAHSQGALLHSISTFQDDAAGYRAYIQRRGAEIIAKKQTFAVTG